MQSSFVSFSFFKYSSRDAIHGRGGTGGGGACSTHIDVGMYVLYIHSYPSHCREAAAAAPAAAVLGGHRGRV